MLQTKLNNAIFSSIQSPSLCKDVGDGGDYGVSVSVLVLPLQTITESVDTFPRDRAQPRVYHSVMLVDRTTTTARPLQPVMLVDW